MSPPDNEERRPGGAASETSRTTKVNANHTACGCCQGTGWTSPDTWFSCRVDHDETFDFAGTVMVACPHCNDSWTTVEPLRQPCESVEQASRLLAPLAAMVVSRHVDDLGFHRGELRQQRALDRLERIFGYGHHAAAYPDGQPASGRVAA